MSTIKRTLVLTGARAGRTCQCGKFNFVSGMLKLSGALNHVDGVTKYLARSYAAYPEGSNELLAAQKRDAEAKPKEAGNGVVPIHPVHATEREPGVSGGNGSDGQGVASIPTLVIGRADDPDTGGAERVPDGDGFPDTGDDQKIAGAVTALDHKNDEHWTRDGLPAVHAVATLSGVMTATRAMIESAAPNARRSA